MRRTPIQLPLIGPYISIASYAYIEQVGVKRQADGRNGEINRLYPPIARNKSHFKRSPGLYQPRLQEQLPDYTLQLNKRLPQDRPPRQQHNIKALTQIFVQRHEQRAQPPFDAIALGSHAQPSASHDAIAVVRQGILAEAQSQ